LGGSGYVAAEAVRLLLGHPQFELGWVVSSSSPGALIAETFPHLSGPAGSRAFVSEEEFVSQSEGPVAVLSALPHGVSGDTLERLMARLPEGSRAFDLSADLRAPGAALAGRPVFCGLPDLSHETPAGPVAEPGCFATAVTLAAAPLVAHGLVDGPLVFSGVTGSTASGNTPKPGTHHPTRNGGLWAYETVRHRHADEVEMMLGRLGTPGPVWFVPHSGPFSRGIHVTLQTGLNQSLASSDLARLFEGFYAHTPFVSASTRMPNLREVQTTNRCHIGVSADGGRAVVTSVIDNLVKGAAGGGVQWMNRVYGFAEAAGLDQPGVMWA
jgi:N-acetyl-gamma-glutamyl-phosphate reductase